jgi:hypothetical protein
MIPCYGSHLQVQILNPDNATSVVSHVGSECVMVFFLVELAAEPIFAFCE